jgi:hypothetical protein
VVPRPIEHRVRDRRRDVVEAQQCRLRQRHLRPRAALRGHVAVQQLRIAGPPEDVLVRARHGALEARVVLHRDEIGMARGDLVQHAGVDARSKLST